MKRKDVIDAYKLNSDRSNRTNANKEIKSKPISIRRKSLYNGAQMLKLNPDSHNIFEQDYATSMKSNKNENRNISLYNLISNWSSSVHTPRPLTSKRSHIISSCQGRDTSRTKSRKSSNSRSSSARKIKPGNSVERVSNKSPRQLLINEFYNKDKIEEIESNQRKLNLQSWSHNWVSYSPKSTRSKTRIKCSYFNNI